MNFNSNQRGAGVLLHISSLPSNYGIGDMGKSALEFTEFLHLAGQKYWQILPLGPTGYGNSPYSTYSSYAGNYMLINPDNLYENNLLLKEDLLTNYTFDKYNVVYEKVKEFKLNLLKKAYLNYKKRNNHKWKEKFKKFCTNQSYWLDNYSLFMALLYKNNKISWPKWKKTKVVKQDTEFIKFIQFIFYMQWFKLKKYVNSKGIKIIGDMPFFVPLDSADVWGNKELFSLNKNNYPYEVAGVPPDYFSSTGQKWGMPTYNWEKHKEDNYKWWVSRIIHSLNIYDILKIDHFRGFSSYWAIPAKNKTAINGKWKKSPSYNLLDKIFKKIGENNKLIAEDLGYITPDVEELREHYSIPGMKVLQFGFEDLNDNLHLPHNYEKNSVVYTGTHDNNTTLGWYFKIDENKKDRIRKYLSTDGHDICYDFIRLAYSTTSRLCIIPLQDILGFGEDTRMNIPGTPKNNWKWRFTSDMLSESINKKLNFLCNTYYR